MEMFITYGWLLLISGLLVGIFSPRRLTELFLKLCNANNASCETVWKEFNAAILPTVFKISAAMALVFIGICSILLR